MTRSRAHARPTRPAATVAALALVAALGLAGCDQQPRRTSEQPAPTRSSAAAPSSPAETDSTPVAETSEATPTTATTPTTPTTSATASQAPAGTLADRLLPGEEVPGFNDGFRWVSGRTRSTEGRALFGTCQRFGITSIGATDVAVRDYRPVQLGQANPPAEAGELVAELPDTATAQRAFAVLKSWREQCADRLSGTPHHVGALQSVSVGGGTGGWYLLTYPSSGGDPDAAFFDAQGIAVVGTRIVMLELRNVGQDYNYEAGQEPMVAAVQKAAGRLG